MTGPTYYRLRPEDGTTGLQNKRTTEGQLLYIIYTEH